MITHLDEVYGDYVMLADYLAFTPEEAQLTEELAIRAAESVLALTK